MKTKLKQLDIISVLLILFLVTIPLFLFFTKTISSNIRQFSQQSTYITHLQLLDNDFNYFTAKKGLLSNYDMINQKVQDFYSTLTLLKENLHTNYIKNNKKYIKALDSIKNDFDKKVKLIEHTKSYNSMVIHSLNYIHDLKKTFYNLTKDEYNKIDDIVFLSIEFSNKNLTDKSILLKKLESIKYLLNTNENIKYFYIHEKMLIKRITLLNKEYKEIEKTQIYKRLDNIYHSLKSDFNTHIYLSNIIISAILVFVGFLLISIIILHRKSLKNKKELVAYKYAIENSDNGIVITDKDFNITYVNKAFERVTGYKKYEVIGKNPRILKSDLLPSSYYQNLKDTIKNRKKWIGEFINKHKNGSIFYEKASISPIIIDGETTGYISLKLDITEYINQKKHIEFLAYHDSLTTLANRAKFEEYFHKNIENKNKKTALVYLDLDNFKTINDTLGHNIGDELLKIFSKKIEEAASKDDFIARLGGDEFVVLVDITHDKTKVDRFIEKLNKSLSTTIEIDTHTLNISTSIGIALYPENGNSLNELLKYADIALYHVKANGKNRFQYFNKNLSKQLYEKITLEEELKKALENNELYMVYQPKYNLKTQEIVGFEALMRWESKKLGSIPPLKFIMIAEETGLINEISDFAFEQACSDFYMFKVKYPSLKSIAVNISTKQFLEENFISKVKKATKKSKLKPEDIELEITETYLMKNIDQNIKYLKSLKNLGYKIAIDDFGTGYSSFSYLKKMPITTLKIDKAFVDDICIDKKDKNIVKTIINLAKSLGFQTVAEGIESKDQERLLVEMSCDLGQGFVFSKPLKVEDAFNLLKTQNSKQNIKKAIEMMV